MDQQKVNTGAIFKNENKKDQKHPDYRGKINCDGKDMEIALWLRESQKGVKYFSASLSEPYVKPDESTSAAPVQSAAADDDLPF
jgi:uncharacterized protein (DUF736 family)